MVSTQSISNLPSKRINQERSTKPLLEPNGFLCDIINYSHVCWHRAFPSSTFVIERNQRLLLVGLGRGVLDTTLRRFLRLRCENFSMTKSLIDPKKFFNLFRVRQDVTRKRVSLGSCIVVSADLISTGCWGKFVGKIGAAICLCSCTLLGFCFFIVFAVS